MAKKYVKCLICGEVFESGVDTCPVCGVDSSNFVEVEVDDVESNDSNQKIVIIGNGIAGINAATEIRKSDKTCSITMISAEKYPGYNRPMLTKSLLENMNIKDLLVHDEAWYKENKIDLYLNTSVEFVDNEMQIVSLSNGDAFKYDKLVIATGSSSNKLKINGSDLENVLVIRTYDDYKKINNMINSVMNVCVVGAGVLGLEAAWELKKMNCNVTLLEYGNRLLSKFVSEEASEILYNIITSSGINVLLNNTAKEIKGDKKASGVVLSNGDIIDTDMVIMSVGVTPNISLFPFLKSNRGLAVDEYLKTSDKNIYACGDVVGYKCLWSEASDMGSVVGANIVGRNVKYDAKDFGLSMNAYDTSLFVIGKVSDNVSYKVIEQIDKEKNSYLKYYFENDKFKAGVLIGDKRNIPAIVSYYENEELYQNIKK